MRLVFLLLRAAALVALATPWSAAQTATPPVIASLSGSQTTTEGSPVTLSVSVNGTTPFSYQWFKDGTALPGATASLYSIASARVADSGYYTVNVANIAGTVTGGPLVLSVTAATAPRISYFASSASYYVGDTLNLDVSVSGTPPYSYEWRRNGTPLASGTSSRYQKSNLQVADSGAYTVTVSNLAGTVTSSPATITVNPLTAPVIASSPSDTTVNSGDTLNLYVNVSRMGNSVFTYQWNKDGTAVAGATQSTYSKYNASAADAGSYTVTVTNSVGSTTSTAARVTVRAPTGPTINYAGDTRLTVASGSSFSFYASVSGSQPITFQWYKDGVALGGATTQSFGRSLVTLEHAGVYTLVATNAQGSSTSQPSRVAVIGLQPPVILRAPISQDYAQGDSIYLGAETGGSPPLSYQWRKDGVVLAGATGSGLSVTNRAAASDSGSYTLTVSNPLGTVVSEPALVTVRLPDPPIISVHPVGRTSNLGDAINFQVQISGNRGQTTFQWYKDGVAIPNANSEYYYSSSGATAASAGDYTATITNPAGSVTSMPARLTVRPLAAPVITQHPASGSVLPGESFSGLSIGLRPDAGNVTYQWQRDGAPIPGATSSSYYLGNTTTLPGTYRVVVTNAAGTATSRDAAITVDPATTRPAITSVSGSRSVAGGSGTSVGIALSGSYAVQWQFEGVDIPNANRPELNLTNFGPANVGTYTARVTTPGGPLTSRPIVLDLLDAGQTPEVLTEPASQLRNVGDHLSLEVRCAGETPLSYQWRKDGVAIPGATTASYSLGPLTVANAGRYTLTATNRHGTATSAAAVVSVFNGADRAPVITAHPASAALVAGSSTTTLNVGMTSFVGATFQWKKDGVAISGATSSTYNLGYPLNANMAGRYSVTVTNPAGSATSRDAVITLARTPQVPTVTTSPTSQTVLTGGTATFTVAATGASRFQWRKDGVDLSGATASTLEVPVVQPADAGTYVAFAVNDDGVAPSLPAQLTVQTPAPGVPVVMVHPRDITVLPGNTGTFRAGIAANPAATYQWRKDGVPIAGATALTLVLPNVTAAAVGAYQLLATNSFGAVVTNPGRLTLGTPISFAAQPRSQAVPAGGALTLTVTAVSSSPVTYQWFKNGTALAGATAASFSLAAVRPEDAGSYTVVVTNADGAVESAAAVVAIASSPFAGTYQGGFGSGDTWAMHVAADGTAEFHGALSASQQLIVARGVVIAASGAFRFSRTPVNTTGHTPVIAGRYFEGAVEGTVDGTVVRGTVPALGLAFNGGRVTAGATAALAGAYAAVPLASEVGEVHVLAMPDGTLQLLAALPGGVHSGRGQLSPAGTFTFAHPNFSYSGALTAERRGFTGSLQPAGGGTPVTLAAPAAAGGSERLANVATRGTAGTGGRVLIAGFVISGTTPRDVLIRAAGPALAAFGVSGAVANPRLRVFRGETALYDNDDWSLGGFGGTIAATATRLGAFPFAAGSADAALIVRLAPGGYSAQVTSDAGSGVALIEVYDAGTSAVPAERLVNLSTRGDVGTGGDILIVGLVVAGDAPKKFLIRGVGPGLAAFGVPGTLVDPQLRLFRGSTLLRENDDWSGTDAALLAEAAVTVGAFALPAGSKDAALLLYLAPGAYSAQLSGVGGTTGVGLVEAYEVP